MPCNTRYRNREEEKKFQDALKKLEEDIETGRRTVQENLFTGEVVISDWDTSEACAVGWCDGCCLEVLSSRGSDWVKESLRAGGVEHGKEFVSAGHNGHPHGGSGHKH